jgi:hypothetical protein
MSLFLRALFGFAYIHLSDVLICILRGSMHSVVRSVKDSQYKKNWLPEVSFVWPAIYAYCSNHSFEILEFKF